MKNSSHILQFTKLKQKQLQDEELHDLSIETPCAAEPKTRIDYNFQGLQALKRSIIAAKESSQILHESTNTRTIPEISHEVSHAHKLSTTSTSTRKESQNQGNVLTRACQTLLSLSNFVESYKQGQQQGPPLGYDENKLYFKDSEIRKLAESSNKYRDLSWKKADKQLEYFKVLKESGMLNNKFYGYPGEVMDLKVSRITGVSVELKTSLLTNLNVSHITLNDVKRELAQSNYRRKRNLSVFDQTQTREDGSLCPTPKQEQILTGVHRRNASDARSFYSSLTQRITSPAHNGSDSSFRQLILTNRQNFRVPKIL